MPKLPNAVEVAGVTAAGSRRKQPVLSRRWLRDAVAENRSAFEFEMRRERRRLLDSRFDAFWKETSARQARAKTYSEAMCPNVGWPRPRAGQPAGAAPGEIRGFFCDWLAEWRTGSLGRHGYQRVTTTLRCSGR